MKNFSNYLYTSNQGDSKVFLEMLNKLESADFTGPAQSSYIINFTDLYPIVINFYKTHFPVFYRDFIPLYLALWKVRVKDVIGLNNMHQDGGIYYFAKNGYQSRMITLWTCLYKDNIPSLSDNDLGLYVIDNEDPNHQKLYQMLIQKNTHFYQKDSKKLYDIRQIGNITVSYDLDSLRKQYFDYSKGTTIQFNSHLLHGTKSLEANKPLLQSCDFTTYRASLTSTWIHRDDLNRKVLQMNEGDYEELYLSGITQKDNRRIKDLYAPFFQKEIMRLHRKNLLNIFFCSFLFGKELVAVLIDFS